jgi:hypothetical protein
METTMETDVKSEQTAIPRTKSRQATSQTIKTKPGRQAGTKVKDKTPAGQTPKQDTVVAMLRRKEGATIAAIMKVTDWQRHSVHGFLAGVVRKKLKLNLSRIGEGDKASYRISEGKRIPPASRSQKQVIKNPDKTGRSAGKRPR